MSKWFVCVFRCNVSCVILIRAGQVRGWCTVVCVIGVCDIGGPLRTPNCKSAVAGIITIRGTTAVVRVILAKTKHRASYRVKKQARFS